MGFRGVWLTLGVAVNRAVNRRFRADRRHDSQETPRNSTASTAFWPPVDWQQWAEERPLRSHLLRTVSPKFYSQVIKSH
jgi:hypothetical protein